MNDTLQVFEIKLESVTLQVGHLSFKMDTKLKFMSKNIHLYFGLISCVHTWKDWGNICRIGLFYRKCARFLAKTNKNRLYKSYHWRIGTVPQSITQWREVWSRLKNERACVGCSLSNGLHKTKTLEKMWAKTADIGKEWLFPVFCAYHTIFEILRDTKRFQIIKVFRYFKIDGSK